MKKRLASAALAAGLIAGSTVPAVADEHDPNIVDTVIAVSGAEGFDHRRGDFDVLREALLATGLAEAVASAQDITVFAPNDYAFIRLARDLGYDSWDEAGVIGFLAAATGFESAEQPGLLDDVLLYHVAPSRILASDLDGSPIETLLAGATFTPDGTKLRDGDPNSRDPRIVRPNDIEVANGVIHTINAVLRPLDLPPEAPATVVDAVIATSGAEGFDNNRSDYDVLREALVASGLVGAVAEADAITVFAPNDRAFIRLARDLGYDGWDEAEAFAVIAGATGFQSADDPGLLDDVLLYHVLPGSKGIFDVQGEQPTLLDGASVTVRIGQVIDADVDDRNAWIRRPFNLETGNGTIHTINRVLRPIDLP